MLHSEQKPQSQNRKHSRPCALEDVGTSRRFEVRATGFGASPLFDIVTANCGTSATRSRLAFDPSNGETNDEIQGSWRCSGCRLRAGEPRNGPAGRLQPRLLRAVLSERQLPEQRTRQSLYRRLSATAHLPRWRQVARRQCRLELRLERWALSFRLLARRRRSRRGRRRGWHRRRHCDRPVPRRFLCLLRQQRPRPVRSEICRTQRLGLYTGHMVQGRRWPPAPLPGRFTPSGSEKTRSNGRLFRALWRTKAVAGVLALCGGVWSSSGRRSVLACLSRQSDRAFSAPV